MGEVNLQNLLPAYGCVAALFSSPKTDSLFCLSTRCLYPSNARTSNRDLGDHLQGPVQIQHPCPNPDPAHQYNFYCLSVCLTTSHFHSKFRSHQQAPFFPASNGFHLHYPSIKRGIEPTPPFAPTVAPLLNLCLVNLYV